MAAIDDQIAVSSVQSQTHGAVTTREGALPCDDFAVTTWRFEGALRSSVQAKAKDTKKARSETGKRQISEGGSQSQMNQLNGNRNSTASDLLFLP